MTIEGASLSLQPRAGLEVVPLLQTAPAAQRSPDGKAAGGLTALRQARFLAIPSVKFALAQRILLLAGVQ
jgi:hypothetical protein